MPYPMVPKKFYDYCPACGNMVPAGKDYKDTRCCSEDCNQWMITEFLDGIEDNSTKETLITDRINEFKTLLEEEI